MLSDLNVDQWVMVRDRHRLNRLRKGKDSNEAQYQELFEKSNYKVRDRLSRLPNIRLNQDLPVTQSAEQLIQAIQQNQVIIVAGKPVQVKPHNCRKLPCWPDVVLLA